MCTPTFPHPLFLGRLMVRHKGCWASEFTNKFNFLFMNIFVYEYYKDSIDVYAIIKAKNNGMFTLDQVKSIYNEINLNTYVIASQDDVISNKALIFHLRIQDLGPTRFVVRSIRLFGLIPFEIGLHIEGGIETLYALFSSPKLFDECKRLLKTVYGNDFLEDSSVLSPEPGLKMEIPLFAETVMCNIARFEVYRELINRWIAGGIEFTPEDWNWTTLEYVNQINKGLHIKPEELEKERSMKPPTTTLAKLKRVVKKVTQETYGPVLAYWFTRAAKFLIERYFKIRLDDP